MVLLDGMVLYQPFHLLGFYSAFPSDVIDHTDIYAGGFGAKYGRRLASVIDVSTRTGNKHTFSGRVSLSPFIGEVRLEGPLGTDRVSGLVSGRQSTVERGAGPILGEEMPFSFGDVFGKVHADVTETGRLSISAVRTHDRGRLGPDADVGALPEETIQADPFGEVRWQNWGVGGRYLTVPGDLSVVTDVHLSMSGLRTELGPPDAPTRTSRVQTTRLAFDARFPREHMTVQTGFQGSFSRFSHELGGLYQDTFTDALTTLDHIVAYVEPEVRLGGFRVQPGLRLQFLKSRFNPFLVPRLRASWTTGRHRVSAAGGVYYQGVGVLSDRRDAASVFTAWTNVPKHSGLPRDDVRRGRTPRALDGVLGYRVRLTPGLTMSLEGYYRDLSDLFIAEWTAFPRFTTRLQPADGRSYGAELRLEGTRLDEAGSKALNAYARRPAEDAILLIIGGKLEAAAQKGRWFNALDQAGVVVRTWPIDARQLPGWIERRLQAAGLQAPTGAAALLAERVEGNLLAAAQEIEKLQVLFGSQQAFTVEQLLNVVSDSARYSVYDLIESALEADAGRVVRILNGLRGEGVEPVLVSWALHREIRQLASLSFDLAQGLSVESALARQQVWERHKPLLRRALQRLPANACRQLLKGCARLDRLVKGAEKGRIWDELLGLSLRLAGQQVLNHEKVGRETFPAI
jgi:DNA polymerase III delta subunit